MSKPPCDFASGVHGLAPALTDPRRVDEAMRVVDPKNVIEGPGELKHRPSHSTANVQRQRLAPLPSEVLLGGAKGAREGSREGSGRILKGDEGSVDHSINLG